jgi:hypothetical protein
MRNAAGGRRARARRPSGRTLYDALQQNAEALDARTTNQMSPVHFLGSNALRFLLAGLLLVGIEACGARAEVTRTAEGMATSRLDSAAIGIATQRLAAHGQDGFSVDNAKRTRDWFTPELFALLMRDMSDSNGVGYLDWDPFTGAQDDVGPLRFEEMTRVGDTVRVRFSREGFAQKRESVTLAMRYLDGRWLIANFLYPDHTACHQDLAVGLLRYAQSSAAKHEGCQ